MPATATPRKPQTLARKLVETRNTSRNRSLAAMLGLGDSEKELARDFGSGLNDVLGRGTIASLIGLPGDLGGLAENGIRSALGMPQIQPYGGSEHIGQKLEEAGLVSPVRRPKTELLASLISPSQAASAAYRAPQMARAGVRALDNAVARNTMGRGLANSQVGAITPDTFPILKNMKRDEFLGSPRILGKSDAADLRPRELVSHRDVDAVPFMDGRYTAKYTPDGAVVYDNGNPIASYNFGDTLVVDKKYRNKGIGSELVYQQRTYFPEPAVANTRNKVSQGIQEKVWDRIQRDLANSDIVSRNGQPVGNLGKMVANVSKKPVSRKQK